MSDCPKTVIARSVKMLDELMDIIKHQDGKSNLAEF
jgi:hypothetical protein